MEARTHGLVSTCGFPPTNPDQQVWDRLCQPNNQQKLDFSVTSGSGTSGGVHGAWGSLVSSTGYWWEVQLYRHLPTWALCSWTWSSSKARVLLCSLPGKEGTSLPRGSDGELRHHTVTSGIWLICGKIFTDNCNWSFIGSKMTCCLQLDEWMLLRETGRSSEHRGRGEEPCSHRCRQPRWPPDTAKGTKEMPYDKALSF